MRVVSGIDNAVRDLKNHITPSNIPDPVIREKIRAVVELQETHRQELIEAVEEDSRPWFDFLRWPLLGVVLFLASLISWRVLSK